MERSGSRAFLYSNEISNVTGGSLSPFSWFAASGILKHGLQGFAGMVPIRRLRENVQAPLSSVAHLKLQKWSTTVLVNENNHGRVHGSSWTSSTGHPISSRLCYQSLDLEPPELRNFSRPWHFLDHCSFSLNLLPTTLWTLGGQKPRLCRLSFYDLRTAPSTHSIANTVNVF